MLETPQLAPIPIDAAVVDSNDSNLGLSPLEPSGGAARPFMRSPMLSLRARARRRAAGAKAAQPVHMPAVSALLAERLPLEETKLSALLARERLVPAPFDLQSLTRLYRSTTGEIPFRILRCGGMTIAVEAALYDVSSQLASVAIRMVRYWGLTSVLTVAERVSALTSAAVTVPVAERLLAAIPRVHWLDGERRRWFSFDGDTGRFDVTIRKIFAVAPAVRVDELRGALARALPGAYEAPRSALERCLVAMGRCTIEAGVVRRAGSTAGAPNALTIQEKVMVGLLDSAGGTLTAPSLRQRALAAGVPKTTVNQTLRQSPLFMPVGGRAEPPSFRLIGREPEH